MKLVDHEVGSRYATPLVVGPVAGLGKERGGRTMDALRLPATGGVGPFGLVWQDVDVTQSLFGVRLPVDEVPSGLRLHGVLDAPPTRPESDPQARASRGPHSKQDAPV